MKTSQRTHQNPPTVTGLAAAKYWNATLQRDRRADGSFVFAVRSTHIYCRPSCPARRPLRQNALFFRTPREAENLGYRPCRRCKPNELQDAVALVAKAAARLANSEEETIRLESIASEINSSPEKLRRAFRSTTGLSTREFAEAARMSRFKKLLREGHSITEALYTCGFGSPSRIYEKTNSQLGMTPALYKKGAPGMQIEYSITRSSLGHVLVAATERGISAIYLGENDKQLAAELRAEYPKAELSVNSTGHAAWVREVLKRIDGDAPSLDLPLDVQATAFQRRVWQELQKIPLGSTRTYTQVAHALGKPNSVRAVARACGRNPVSIVVPCHRVIRTDGQLAGYRWGLKRKQQLLEREGSQLNFG
jgi:AraC family transcriptional regulator, regulatory protein of adaptative response / methylated-DNA-[protein]-cysteine methyltransferase